MNRLKALHVVHDSPRISSGCGGTEQYVDALADATGDPVLTRQQSGDGELIKKEGGYPLWVFCEAPPKRPRFRDTYAVPGMEAALSKVIEETEVDVVHLHHFAHIGFGAAEQAARQKIPVVFHLHDYHSICVRGQLVERNMERCSGPEESRCATCVLEHLRARPSLHFLGQIAGGLGFRSHARNWIAKGQPNANDIAEIQGRFEASKNAFAHIDRCLSPSQHLAQKMVELGWIASDSIHVMDLPLLEPMKTPQKRREGGFRILFVGSLIPTKGPQILLEACKELDAEVYFYGPTPTFDGHPGWGEKLIARIQQQDNAFYGGVFSSIERERIYGEADLLALPSIWEENSPLVLREGLASGLPVVASAVGGMSELAPDAHFVKPDCVTSLREALKEIVQQGRHRNPPKHWDMHQHQEQLQTHYQDIQKR